MWIQIAPSVRRRVEAANREFIAAVHAAEHALTCVLPLFIACDRADTGTEHIGPYRERRLPSRLVLYDKRPGGVAEEAFERIAEIAAAALALVRDCACQSGGCP
jgi:DEAD/DEAH box helicase domain-containing protein